MSVVYESPDGGKTVYATKIGSDSRVLVSKLDNEEFDPKMFYDIIKQSKNNLTLKKALENVILIYNVVKDD